jgi:cysteine desulfuration protein SufE
MSLTRLQEIIDTFQSVDDDLRLELLLDYSRRLPPLPQRYYAERDAGLNRVPECMTPVFLWVECDGQQIHLHADVAEESPTVQGLLAIIVDACDGAHAADVVDLPHDLLHQLGLGEQIRMTRAVGLAAIVERIRREVEHAAGTRRATIN